MDNSCKTLLERLCFYGGLGGNRSMKDILQALESQEDFMKFGKISRKLITESEKILELHFSLEYKKYVSAYSHVIYDGHELTGICSSKRLNVVDVTLKERKNNPFVPQDWYVVEQTNIDGIVIWQNAKGEIYQTAPNEEPLKICDSLAEYVENY